MANNPHPGGPKGETGRDEPNRRGGSSAGNRGADRGQGDAVASPAPEREVDDEALTRGAPPKKRKRYSHAD
jgi:hypothetical protein